MIKEVIISVNNKIYITVYCHCECCSNYAKQPARNNTFICKKCYYTCDNKCDCNIL